jgi:hypothetical protein
MERDPTSVMLDDAYHDVPWHSPDLVEHALAGLRSPGSTEIRERLASLAGDAAASSSRTPLARRRERNGRHPLADLLPHPPPKDPLERAHDCQRDEQPAATPASS